MLGVLLLHGIGSFGQKSEPAEKAAHNKGKWRFAAGIMNTANNIFTGIENAVNDGSAEELLHNDVGLFLNCKVPQGQKFFEGECHRNIKNIDGNIILLFVWPIVLHC